MLKKKQSKKKTHIFTIILSICDILAFIFLFLLYGPFAGFRDWLVTTAMSTMNHQYLATTFYSDKAIKKIISRHNIIEPEANTDINLILGEEKSYLDDMIEKY